MSMGHLGVGEISIGTPEFLNQRIGDKDIFLVVVYESRVIPLLYQVKVQGKVHVDLIDLPYTEESHTDLSKNFNLSLAIF